MRDQHASLNLHVQIKRNLRWLYILKYILERNNLLQTTIPPKNDQHLNCWCCPGPFSFKSPCFSCLFSPLKSKWKAVISSRAACLPLKDFAFTKISTCLSEWQIWLQRRTREKACFLFTRATRLLRCLQHNAEIDFITQATQWFVPNTGSHLWREKIQTRHKLSPFKKRNDHSLQMSCIMNSGPLNIPSVWKVQVDWTPSNKLWRFSFILPLQSSEMAYGSFI